MKRLIKKAEVRMFYHGSPLPRALDIIQSGAINTMNSQTEGLQTEQNVSLQENAVYVTTNINTAKSYALNHNQYDWGIIFEMNLDTDSDPLTIDEDTFFWGEGLNANDENRETFLKMFGGDKEKASNFIKSIIDSGFFNDDLMGYDPYDEEYFEILQENYVAQDNEGYYYMDLSGLQFANVEMANEIIRQIPFEDQLKANDSTFAYEGNINLSQVGTVHLIGKNEEFSFTNVDELIAKYEEVKKPLE